MGDEPYTIPLPWVVFAVIARSATHGVVWASVAAVITAATLLATRRGVSGVPNTLMAGAVAWFAGLGLLGVINNSPTSWLAHNGRAVSAFGFVVIALVSLVFTPAAASYTRMLVKPSRWKSPRFESLNIHLTLLWALAFLGIATSHLAATWLSKGSTTGGALTTFNWIVPVALGVIAAHWSRRWWDEFVDADTEHSTADALWDLAFAPDDHEMH